MLVEQRVQTHKNTHTQKRAMCPNIKTHTQKRAMCPNIKTRTQKTDILNDFDKCFISFMHVHFMMLFSIKVSIYI